MRLTRFISSFDVGNLLVAACTQYLDQTSFVRTSTLTQTSYASDITLNGIHYHLRSSDETDAKKILAA